MRSDGALVVRHRPGEATRLTLTPASHDWVLVGGIPAAFEGSAVGLACPLTLMQGQVETPWSGAAASEIRFVRLADGEVAAFTVASTEGRFSSRHLPQGNDLITGDGVSLLTFPLTDRQEADLGTLRMPLR